MQTTGANWPGASARMRTSSAYLAAHHYTITHRACVKIVRDGLRETGLVSSRINPTRGYQSGYRPIVPRRRHGQTLTNVDMRTANAGVKPSPC